MAKTGKSKTCVWRWQERFMHEGVNGLLRDRFRPRGEAPIPPERVAEIVHLTQQAPPHEANRFISVGSSPSTISCTLRGKKVLQSGRPPSTSVRPYSFESAQVENKPPLFAPTFGSAASAATARPTRQGVSDSATWGSFSMALGQFASVTPNVSSTASERRNPGVIASAVTRWA